ncbi:MAG: hypothetical protein V3V03_09330 [Hyphomonadaceae bacterium]
MADATNKKLYGTELIRKYGFWKIVGEDFDANFRDWTEPGFRALFIYRFGVWRKTIRFWPLRKAIGFIYVLLYRHVRNHYTIQLHDSCFIGRRLRIAHQGAINIHRFSSIGDDCIIRLGVTLGAPGSEVTVDTAPVLGDRVDLGVGAVIIGKVLIGDDASIGPNVVVQTNIKPGSLVVQAPPRIIPGFIKPPKVAEET